MFYFIQYKSEATGITADAGINFTSFNYNDYIKYFLQLCTPVALFQMSPNDELLQRLNELVARIS